MRNLVDEILSELEYHSENGIIDFTKKEQVIKLEELLKKGGADNSKEVSERAALYFSYLNEANITVKNKKSGNIYTVSKMDPNVHTTPTPAEIEKAKKANAGKLPTSDKSTSISKSSKSKQKTTPSVDIDVTDAEKAKQKSIKSNKVKKIDDSIRKKDLFNKDKSMVIGLDETESQKRLKANKVKKINNNPALSDKDIKYIFEQNTKFPKKYLKVLDRLLQNSPDGATITMFTDKAGAGTLASTAGEIIGMIGLSIQDPDKRKYFFNKLTERVKENGGNGIADESWIKASEAHCFAAERKLKRDFPNGYTILNTFWDVADEANSIGVENYKDNKGFSTDVNMIVKDNKTNEIKWIEPSLKKTEKVNLLNGTTNRVRSIAVLSSKNVSDSEKDEYESMTKELESMGEIKKGKTPEWKRKEELIKKVSEIEKRVETEIPKEANPTLAYQRQLKLHESVYSNKDNLTEVKQLLNTWDKKSTSEKAKLANDILSEMGQTSKPALVKEVLNTLNQLSKSKNNISELRNVGEIIGDTTSRGTQKASMFLLNLAAATDTKGKLTKIKTSIDSNSNKHAKGVAEYLLFSNETKTALLRSIRDAFPVKSLLEGEENMFLGDTKKGQLPGTNIDQYVLQRVFNVKSAEEFQSGLKVFDTPPPPHISFIGKGKDATPIEIATIKSRSDGKGYGGTWKLEMALSDKFVTLCKQYDI